MMNTKSFTMASLLMGGMLISFRLSAQELYVFSEPASTMPAKSISVKGAAKFAKSMMGDNYMQRYTPEIMLGLSKKWMLHGSSSFSDMFSSNLRWESAKIYSQYRFYSVDEIHRHFRMAGFGELAIGRNRKQFDELSGEGDHSNLRAGLIATQLVNKLAVSATGSYLLYTGRRPKEPPQPFPYQALGYSVSAGLLVLPIEYTSFRQTNLNIYVELLGQRTIDMKRYYLDFAPSIQLIFNSNTKLNLGYRYQIAGNMHRMAEKGWRLSLERAFLNALR